MNEPTKPATAPEMSDEEILQWQRVQDEKRAEARRQAKVERARLAFKYSRELGGAEGSAFFIHDTGDLGEGMVVVKLGDALRWQSFLDVEKPTDADRHDLLEACVVHPTREQFQTLVAKRKALYLELANRLGALYGLKIRSDEGK